MDTAKAAVGHQHDDITVALFADGNTVVNLRTIGLALEGLLANSADATEQVRGEATDRAAKLAAMRALVDKGGVGRAAVGGQVARAAGARVRRVSGHDPDITVRRAWELPADVQKAPSVDARLSGADFVPFHVPLVDSTRRMINAERLRLMKDGVVLLNFSRNGILDDEAVCAALDEGKVYSYVCDFPSNLLKDHPRVVTLPHLGASTREAEENCAVMVVDNVREFLENGNVTRSFDSGRIVSRLNVRPMASANTGRSWLSSRSA